MEVCQIKMGGDENAGKLNFEETELRLGIGLPGDHNYKAKITTTPTSITNAKGKRGFTESSTDDHVDLQLNFTSKEMMDQPEEVKILPKEKKNLQLLDVSNYNTDQVMNPPAKAQVVGWPPVGSYRKNLVLSVSSSDQKSRSTEVVNAATLVKVSLDGAPYLRKVDLKMYKSYQHLSDALGNMFSSFTINGKCESQGGMKDLMNENSDYVPTYEDKDGDWMLVGDVPWEMFVDSCKRLRIKSKEQASRAMEKCKNRSSS